MKALARNDVVVVRRLEEQYTGKIHIPDSAKEKPLEAIVIAVGPGVYDEMGNRKSVELEPGERVIVGRYAGTEITVNGEKLLCVRESEILVVLSE
jgi:chaperonin GroES